MSRVSSVRSVADALEDAERWRSDREARLKSESMDAEQQLADVKLRLSKLQDQLESLEALQTDLTTQQEKLDDEQVKRVQQGVFGALEEQRDALAERATQLTSAEDERLTMLEPVLAESDLADKLEEYRQFKSAVEPTLESMPESYRGVVLGHHEGVVNVLRERVAEMLADPVHTDGATLPLEVVYALDAPEGNLELLVVVTPVAEEAFSDWYDRIESLEMRISSRLVQAIYEACHGAGFTEAEVMCGGHRGLLALEVDLTGAPKGLEAALEKRFETVARGARELDAGKVEIAVRRVDADHLLAELEDEDDA